MTEIKVLIGLLCVSAALKDSGLCEDDMISRFMDHLSFVVLCPRKKMYFFYENSDLLIEYNEVKKDKFGAFREIWNNFLVLDDE